ncbi:protein Wnt-4 isoform X2 [Drosophila tropicalis]|uniref:protein Wnt-4 isoform X2 n=1 Tax=Drosophila tropicalis TaxID=46794 RepID=UPI0035ABBD4B
MPSQVKRIFIILIISQLSLSWSHSQVDQQQQQQQQQLQLDLSNPQLMPSHNSSLLNTLMSSIGQGGGAGLGVGVAPGVAAGGNQMNQLLSSSTAIAPAAAAGIAPAQAPPMSGIGGAGAGGVAAGGVGGYGLGVMTGGTPWHSSGSSIAHHSPSGHHPGHVLTGLANLGIIVPRGKSIPGIGGGLGYGGTMLNPGVGGGAGMGGGEAVNNAMDMQNLYNEHFISEHTVMAVFTSQGHVGGPCRYMPATRRQNHQCRKETGLPSTLSEARRLATLHCEDQFRYDRWNCSIEIRGKRNIFKKLYKETAFVHALTAAAMTHSIARACAEGRMTKCGCGPRKQNRADQDFQWGGCNDNLKHGKRVTRSFLDLRGGDGDEVSEILRHDSEVGIEAVSAMMKDKCKCHGVSGSCSMKTCWKKMADFNATATLLRQKYNQAIRKAPNQRTMRQAPSSRMKKAKQRRKKPQQSQYTTLYYLETSPTYCSVTKDRQCLHPDNCSYLCCGRGYTTQVFKQVEKCRCRFNNGRCCHLICDYCQRYEDKYFCK